MIFKTTQPLTYIQFFEYGFDRFLTCINPIQCVRTLWSLLHFTLPYLPTHFTFFEILVLIQNIIPHENPKEMEWKRRS